MKTLSKEYTTLFNEITDVSETLTTLTNELSNVIIRLMLVQELTEEIIIEDESGTVEQEQT
jgi:hypothetical protein